MRHLQIQVTAQCLELYQLSKKGNKKEWIIKSDVALTIAIAHFSNDRAHVELDRTDTILFTIFRLYVIRGTRSE